MRRKNHSAHGSAATATRKRRRSTRRGRAQRDLRARRGGLARLRSAYFAKAGELAARYCVSFERVILHLWTARGLQGDVLLLRRVNQVEDLVLAVACAADCGRAWADLCEAHERTMVRRCRDCRDELEATVYVRRFFAEMRRDTLSGRSALRNYAGTRPLRTWLAEMFHMSRQRRRRSAFVLDSTDSAYGMPLQFTPTGADG
jgi:hypothetical protein